MFNFVVPQITVAAVPWDSVTLAVAAGSAAAGAAFIPILAVAAALGVTFYAWEDLVAFKDMVTGVTAAPDIPGFQEAVEQIQSEDLADDDLFNWWGMGQMPPDDLPPPGDKRKILGFLGGTGVMGGFISNYVAMFQKLELDPGINHMLGDTIRYEEMDGSTYTVTVPKTTRFMSFSNGDTWTIIHSHAITDTLGLGTLTVTFPDGFTDTKVYTVNENYPWTGGTMWLSNDWYKDWIVSDGAGLSVRHKKPNQYISPELEPDKGIPFNVNSNSPILTQDPHIGPPTQINLIPIKRLRRTVNPDGETVLVYPGELDDLINDITTDVPIRDILNPEDKPYTITPKPDGTIVIKPETSPYPQPIPSTPPKRPTQWPPLYPDPLEWPPDIPYPPRPLPLEWPDKKPDNWPPGMPYPYQPDLPWPPTKPIPLPIPDIWPPTKPSTPYPKPAEWPDDIPYPYPPVYPYPKPLDWPEEVPYPYPKPPEIPEPQPEPLPPIIPVEPGKVPFIDYRPWFQRIINWLDKIWQKIPEIPKDKGQEPGETNPDDLEEVEVPAIDLSPLKGITLLDKFPFSLPWDIKNSFTLLLATPEAPVWVVPMITEEITIDMNEFNSIAKIVRAFLSLIFIVMLIILTRRFIGGG